MDLNILSSLLLGLVVGYFVHMTKSYFDRKNEIKRKKRESIEKVVILLHEHIEYSSAQYSRNVFDQDNTDEYLMSPLDKADAIIELYFPELDQYIIEIRETQVSMTKLTAELKIMRIKDGDEAFIKYYREENKAEEYGNIYEAQRLAIYKVTEPARIILEENS